tara:strand:+ start:25307 stop:26023 length:717 start_codon:yes stop_codon:yes gene_type:complete
MNKHTRIIRKDYKTDKEICIVIPSAGVGRRMKSYGPKSLIKLHHNQTILQGQLNSIENTFSNYRVILVCGFQADKLMSESPKNIIKIENEFFDTTNVIRSIAMGLRAVDSENVMILYGDLVFNEAALQELDYSFSCTSISKDTMGEGEVGCVVNDSGYLEHMMYDLPLKWNQMIYLEGKELEYFKDLAYNKKNKKLFGFEIINKVIEKGGKIKCIQNDKIKVIDIDTSKDIAKAAKIK